MKQADIMERALKLQGGVLDLLMQENVALKKKLAEPKWKAGHPEHGDEVFVYVENYQPDGESERYYTTDRWVNDNWEIYDSECEVLGWKEIEPYEIIGRLEKEREDSE